RFQRAEEKLIPDVFDGDFDARFLGHRNRLANFLLRALVSIVVANRLVHDGRNQQNAGAAIGMAISQGGCKIFNSQRSPLGIGLGKSDGPVLAIDDSLALQPGFLESREDLLAWN